jgi:hypothetical protein
MFYQFYLIHAWYKNVMLPCAYVLLSGKSEICYNMMLRALVQAGQKRSFRLRPTEICVDFETAIMNTFKFFFNDIEIIGCW